MKRRQVPSSPARRKNTYLTISSPPFSLPFLRPPPTKFHLIHETLRGKEKIDGYEVYKDRRDDSIVAFARLGKLLSGHPDIIHGGSIAALLDNTMGVAFFAAKVRRAGRRGREGGREMYLLSSMKARCF